jgi:hypothetical protein
MPVTSLFQSDSHPTMLSVSLVVGNRNTTRVGCRLPASGCPSQLAYLREKSFHFGHVLRPRHPRSIRRRHGNAGLAVLLAVRHNILDRCDGLDWCLQLGREFSAHHAHGDRDQRRLSRRRIISANKPARVRSRAHISSRWNSPFQYRRSRAVILIAGHHRRGVVHDLCPASPWAFVTHLPPIRCQGRALCVDATLDVGGKSSSLIRVNSRRTS